MREYESLRDSIRGFVISDVIPSLYSQLKFNLKKERGWIGLSLHLKAWDELISVILKGVMEIIISKFTDFILNNLTVKYINIRDASILTGLNQAVLRRYIKKGNLKAVKLKRWLIRVDDLLEFMERESEI